MKVSLVALAEGQIVPVIIGYIRILTLAQTPGNVRLLETTPKMAQT